MEVLHILTIILLSKKIDSFEYRMLITYDNGAGFEEGFGWAYIKINDCPTTSTLTYYVDEGGILSITDPDDGIIGKPAPPGVFDINNDPITTFLDLGPQTKNSTVTVNSNGTFTYTHGGGEDDSDYFLYYAFDGLCTSAPDTVKIIISPENDCPIARTNGYNSLSLTKGASIDDYLNTLFDSDGNPYLLLVLPQMQMVIHFLY